MAVDPRDATDLLTVNDLALDPNLKDDLRQAAPFLMALDSTIATNGTTHKYLKRTSAPVVGFRAINDGRETDASGQTAVTVTLKYLDATFDMDVAYADGFSSPVYGTGPSAAVNSELGEHLAAAMFQYEVQLINGTIGGDADGFTGMADALGSLGGLVTSAGGSTATSQTSCYLVRTGPRDARSVLGEQGNLNVHDPTLTQIAGSSTGTYAGYLVASGGWMGMEVGSAWSLGRIGNIETALTDDDIFGLASLFPATRQPNLCVMNMKGLELLRKSRTSTNPTGAPAPWADMVLNQVPVITTDAILSTEAVLT